MNIDLQKLDNPVWNSLSETHRALAINYNKSKFYDPSYCPFGAFSNGDDVSEGIEEYSKLTSDFFIVGRQPQFPEKQFLKKELVCLQMICEEKLAFNRKDHIVTLTSTSESAALFDLVNKVQPGYFRNNTNKLGDYFGIYNDDMLVAVTGEWMKMDEFTEISAVVTDPQYTGRGFAKQLVAHSVNKIFAENKVPFLHVAASNLAAIALYEKLGFKTRRKISFWNLTTAGI
jgi:ribosomal protein S18 acetylase RimI-like enzyme